jgi:hypothetical protein
MPCPHRYVRPYRANVVEKTSFPQTRLPLGASRASLVPLFPVRPVVGADHAALGAHHAQPELANEEIAGILIDVEDHLVSTTTRSDLRPFWRMFVRSIGSILYLDRSGAMASPLDFPCGARTVGAAEGLGRQLRGNGTNGKAHQRGRPANLGEPSRSAASCDQSPRRQNRNGL